MLSEDELDELYKEINRPYTQEEFALHSKLRTIKSWLEITHAHNHDLIALTQDTFRYLFEGGDKPERKLWVMLRPGNNNDNAACARLHDIARFFGRYEHGRTPRFPIVVYASRSSMTLTDRLEELFFHDSLCDVNHHIKEFFCLIAYEGKPKMTQDDFANALMSEADALIAALTSYSKPLAEFTHRREEELKSGAKVLKVKIVKDEKPKKTMCGKGKQTPFMKKQLEIFKTYLDKHPVCASYSIINRARQCWFEHKAEWDNAAKNKTGYTCYKTLAQAV